MKRKRKTMGKLLNDLQAVFNLYIRLRDAGKPCVSCGKPLFETDTTNASHLFPVKGYPTLRFNESNVHRSCVWCNMGLEGNSVEYLQRLPKRIGQDKVDELLWLADRDRKVNHKWQRHEILEKIEHYKALCKSLSGQ